METPVATPAVVIPSLADMQTMPQVTTSFSLFKEDEKFSFVRVYDPKQQAVKDYRHAVLRYRNVENDKLPNVVKKVAQMVTVPQMVLPDDWKIAMSEKACQVMQGALEDAEDMIIRNLIDEKQASRISWDLLGIDLALDYLTAERVSQRLTREQVENWFVIAGKSFCETRATQLCESKGITKPEDIAKQVAATINAYKDRMAKLAAPVPNLGTNEATALNNMLLVSKLDDDMAKVLKAKLHQILNPRIVESGDL